MTPFWIVVTQYDSDPRTVHEGAPPSGPLVHEGFCLTHEQAKERAEILAGRYGWVTIMQVRPDETPDRSVDELVGFIGTCAECLDKADQICAFTDTVERGRRLVAKFKGGGA